MNKISKREKVMLAVLLALIVGCVYYLFFLTPTLEKKSSLEDQIASMEDQVLMAQTQAAQLKRMQKELKELKAENADIKEIPAFDNSKKLMQSLNMILGQAVQYNLDFTGTTETDGIVRRSVSLSYECNTYKDARAILQNIHDGKYPCVLMDVAINYDETYRISAILTFYEYVE